MKTGIELLKDIVDIHKEGPVCDQIVSLFAYDYDGNEHELHYDLGEIEFDGLTLPQILKDQKEELMGDNSSKYAFWVSGGDVVDLDFLSVCLGFYFSVKYNLVVYIQSYHLWEELNNSFWEVENNEEAFCWLTDNGNLFISKG